MKPNETVRHVRMRQTLERCEKQFLFYAQNHRAKGTPESMAKAVVNENLARDIRSVLDEKEG